MFRCSPQAHSQHTQPLYGISSCSSYVIQYGSCSRIYIYLQGIHSDCHPSSSCHDPGYIPSRLELTNPQACQALLKGLKDTYVYRYADDFCRVCMVFTVSPLAIFSLYYMYTVSRHLLGGEFQPPAAHILTEADSLFHQGVQYENEPRSDGLGQMHDLCCLYLYIYIIVNYAE